VFGWHRDRLVAEASIIVLERFYEVSTLETHRIDPLLLKGKVIVNTRSFGQPTSLVLCRPHPALDREHREAVIFVDSLSEMSAVVLALLEDRISVTNKEFILRKVKARTDLPSSPPAGELCRRTLQRSQESECHERGCRLVEG
jgi:hypothetical protein